MSTREDILTHDVEEEINEVVRILPTLEIGSIKSGLKIALIIINSYQVVNELHGINDHGLLQNFIDEATALLSELK